MLLEIGLVLLPLAAFAVIGLFMCAQHAHEADMERLRPVPLGYE